MASPADGYDAASSHLVTAHLQASFVGSMNVYIVRILYRGYTIHSIYSPRLLFIARAFRQYHQMLQLHLQHRRSQCSANGNSLAKLCLDSKSHSHAPSHPIPSHPHPTWQHRYDALEILFIFFTALLLLRLSKGPGPGDNGAYWLGHKSPCLEKILLGHPIRANLLKICGFLRVFIVRS